MQSPGAPRICAIMLGTEWVRRLMHSWCFHLTPPAVLFHVADPDICVAAKCEKKRFQTGNGMCLIAQNTQCLPRHPVSRSERAADGRRSQSDGQYRESDYCFASLGHSPG